MSELDSGSSLHSESLVAPEDKLPKWSKILKKELDKESWYELGSNIINRGLCDIISALLGRKLVEEGFEVVPLSLMLPDIDEKAFPSEKLAHSALAVRKNPQEGWLLFDPTYGYYLQPNVFPKLPESNSLSRDNPTLIVPLGKVLDESTLRRIIGYPPEGYYLVVCVEGRVISVLKTGKTDPFIESLWESLLEEYRKLTDLEKMQWGSLEGFLHSYYGIKLPPPSVDPELTKKMKRFQEKLQRMINGNDKKGFLQRYYAPYQQLPEFKKGLEKINRAVEALKTPEAQ